MIIRLGKIFLCMLSLAVIGTVGAAAADAQAILYTDISAYINNYPISCYSINDNCGIYVKDLRNYGFNVDYDGESRTVNISRNTDCTEISGTGDVRLPWQKTGTYYTQADDSDITVYLNGTETPSYWVEGNMMILLNNMEVFGSVIWENEIRALFLELPELPKADYARIETAPVPYRYMPSMYELDIGSYDNLSGSLTAWGFVQIERNEPVLENWQNWLMDSYGGYYMDRSKPKAIYLTFNEGYEAGYTQKILDVLTAYRVPAAFFITGEYLSEAPQLVGEMIDRDFIVGNHSESHRALANRSAYDIANDIQTLNDRVKNAFGYEMHYMRPPSGEFSEKAIAISRDMGFDNILWSFAYFDYDGNVVHGSQYAYDTMVRYMHDGAIYLLHTMTGDNAYALESFINYAWSEGYEFRTLDELCYQ